MATPNEPLKNASRTRTEFEMLLAIAANNRFVLVPAAHAPEAITRLIKPNAVVDMAIVVAQNSPEAVDDAESLAKSLTEDFGHYECHNFLGVNGKMAHPIIITYLNK